MYVLASFPGPTQLSVACSTEKRGEPGIFSHVSDVTTNEKFMNIGGLNDSGVIAHALVPAKMVREFVFHALQQSFATSVQSVRFCQRLKTEKHERIAGVSASLPFRCTLYFSVLSQEAASKVMYIFVMLVSGALRR